MDKVPRGWLKRDLGIAVYEPTRGLGGQDNAKMIGNKHAVLESAEEARKPQWRNLDEESKGLRQRFTRFG